MKILYYKATIEENVKKFLEENENKGKKIFDTIKEKEDFLSYYNYYTSSVLLGNFVFIDKDVSYSVFETVGELISNILNYDLIEPPALLQPKLLFKLNNKKSIIELVEYMINSNDELTLEEKFIQYSFNNTNFNNFSINVKKIYNLKKYDDYIFENSNFMINLKEKKSLYPGYEFDSFDEFFIFIFLELIKQNNFIKKCDNCGKYFYPKYRSDTLYCDSISPQDSSKTCKEYAFAKKRSDQLKNNEAMGLYKKIFMQKQMATKRNPNKSEYLQDFENFKKESKEWKAKVKSGEKSEQDYIQWLKSLRGEI